MFEFFVCNSQQLHSFSEWPIIHGIRLMVGSCGGTAKFSNMRCFPKCRVHVHCRKLGFRDAMTSGASGGLVLS